MLSSTPTPTPPTVPPQLPSVPQNVRAFSPKDLHRRIEVDWSEKETYCGILVCFNEATREVLIVYDVDGEPEWFDSTSHPFLGWRFLPGPVVSTVEVKEAISKAEVWVNDYNFGIKVVQEECFNSNERCNFIMCNRCDALFETWNDVVSHNLNSHGYGFKTVTRTNHESLGYDDVKLFPSHCRNDQSKRFIHLEPFITSANTQSQYQLLLDYDKNDLYLAILEFAQLKRESRVKVKFEVVDRVNGKVLITKTVPTASGRCVIKPSKGSSDYYYRYHDTHFKLSKEWIRTKGGSNVRLKTRVIVP